MSLCKIDGEVCYFDCVSLVSSLSKLIKNNEDKTCTNLDCTAENKKDVVDVVANKQVSIEDKYTEEDKEDEDM